MIHEALVHQLSVKALIKETELSPREVDILILLHTSGSLSTPSIHQLLNIRKSEMNRRLGPRLVEAGWLECKQVMHHNKVGIPTNRWWIPESKRRWLTDVMEIIRKDLFIEIGQVYEHDKQWTSSSNTTVLD